MSCCGKSRGRFQAAQGTSKAAAAASKGAPTITKTAPLINKAASQISFPQAGTVSFEYTGRSRLTVIGPVTRKRYDFVGHGARLQIDRRDSNSIATIPALRRV